MEIVAHIDEQGKLKTIQRDMIAEWCRKHSGKTIVLKLEVKRKKRSNMQNAFYHGICVPMVQQGMYELGTEMSLQETHEFLKIEFNYKEVPSLHGELMKVPRSTTELTTVEFMVYIEKIQRFASEYLGIVIPDPNSAPELYSVLIAEHHPSTNVTVINKAS